MNASINIDDVSQCARNVGGFLLAIVAFLAEIALRLTGLAVFILLALAEPFLAVILSALALGCFAASVLFGFILHMPFEHRWAVLGASVVFMGAYFLYRAIMEGVLRLIR
jgi:hypothetical protein